MERETWRGRHIEGDMERGRQNDRLRETGRVRQKDMDNESDTGRVSGRRRHGYIQESETRRRRQGSVECRGRERGRVKQWYRDSGYRETGKGRH